MGNTPRALPHVCAEWGHDGWAPLGTVTILGLGQGSQTSQAHAVPAPPPLPASQFSFLSLPLSPRSHSPKSLVQMAIRSSVSLHGRHAPAMAKHSRHLRAPGGDTSAPWGPGESSPGLSPPITLRLPVWRETPPFWGGFPLEPGSKAPEGGELAHLRRAGWRRAAPGGRASPPAARSGRRRCGG